MSRVVARFRRADRGRTRPSPREALAEIRSLGNFRSLGNYSKVSATISKTSTGYLRLIGAAKNRNTTPAHRLIMRFVLGGNAFCAGWLLHAKEFFAMCDYSLHSVRSRPAKVGDKLVTKDFGTGTRGFASVADLTTAVCVLLHGLERPVFDQIAACAANTNAAPDSDLPADQQRNDDLPRCARVSRWTGCASHPPVRRSGGNRTTAPGGATHCRRGEETRAPSDRRLTAHNYTKYLAAPSACGA